MNEPSAGVRRQNVLIVDDHAVVRRGLRTLLEAETWVDVIREAGSVAAAVAAARDVGLVVMDLGLPDGDGIEACRRIMAVRPETAVLMLTVSDEPELVARALRAGARGYVLKDADPETVLDSVRTVAKGGVVLGPGAGASVLRLHRVAEPALPPPFDRLTPRGRALLAGVARGDSNARIAQRLGVGEKTVRNQLSSVFATLGARDRVQAALLVHQHGLDLG